MTATSLSKDQADLFYEKHFATAMAFFAIALSAGTQFGPLIGGYLIEAQGWRWFFNLCTILIAINLLLALVLLPETTYRRELYAGETAADVDKDAIADEQGEQIEHFDGEKSQSEGSTVALHDNLNAPYAGSYFKDLAHFGDRGFESHGLARWPQRLLGPLRFFASPLAIYAAVAFGITVGG